LTSSPASSITDLAATLNGYSTEDGTTVYAGFIYNESGQPQTNHSLGRVDVQALSQYWDYTYGGWSDDTYTQVYGTERRAQEFQCTSDLYIKYVKLKVYRVGNPGNLEVSIRQTPDGAILDSVTVNANLFSTSASYVTFTFSSGWHHYHSTSHYYIVLKATTGSAGNEVRWRVDTGDLLFGENPHYHHGSTYYYAWRSSDGGTTWSQSKFGTWPLDVYGTSMFEIYGAVPGATLPFSYSLSALNSSTKYYFQAWGYSPTTFLSGSMLNFTTLVHPNITVTPSGAITALTWKTNHDISVHVDYPAAVYDAYIGISTNGNTNYIYMTGEDPTSQYYNSTLAACSGSYDFTIDGSKWVPFYGNYTIEIRLYTAGYSPYYSTNKTFDIRGSAGKATEVSLCGFYPVDGDAGQYTAVGKSVVYDMMVNTTNPSDTVTPYAHLFLTDGSGTVIAQYHSDMTLWSNIPVKDAYGRYSCFSKFTQWASQLRMNQEYCFYIGFSSTKWSASNLDVELLYDDATIVSFEGNNYDWLHPSITHVYDDQISGGGSEYYGVKVSFSTYTESGGGTGTSALGDVTGSTWGVSLGAQIDSATGVSGSSAIVGIFVVAVFALLPIIITHTTPPLPILVMFTGMGLVMSFGMGFFPLWLFFIVVVVVALIIIYRLKSWISHAWSSGGESGTSPKDRASGAYQKLRESVKKGDK
jgi:uncharacterized membrane protein